MTNDGSLGVDDIKSIAFISAEVGDDDEDAGDVVVLLIVAVGDRLFRAFLPGFL